MVREKYSVKPKQTKYANYGENNPKAKLSIQKVANIKYFHTFGCYTYKQLAVIFNVSKSTIGRVCTGQSWK